MVCYVGMGSNLGRRAEHLARAIGLLAAEERVRLRRVSPVYETVPVGYADQGQFLNLALALDTDLSPEELLAITQNVEQALGRERPFPNAPRTIDVDLLVCGEENRDTTTLTLPHPRMLERQFVLAPLGDLAPDLRVSGSLPVGELVERDSADVRKLGKLRDALRSESEC